MLKIYSDQIEKVQMLLSGTQGKDAALRQKNITIEREKLELVCKALEEAAQKQEAAKVTLDECRNAAHALLEELKTCFGEAKQPIKLAFPPEEWAAFGLADKR